MGGSGWWRTRCAAIPGGNVAVVSTNGRAEGRDEGFTLVEVLVAFAIAAPVVALLIGQGALAVRAVRTAARYEEAVSRAQSRLDSILDRTLAAGERDGDDGGGFHWRTRVVMLGMTGAPRQPPRGTPYAGGTTLYDVTVEVSWADGTGTGAATLGTRRLGPSGVSGP